MAPFVFSGITAGCACELRGRRESRTHVGVLVVGEVPGRRHQLEALVRVTTVDAHDSIDQVTKPEFLELAEGGLQGAEAGRRRCPRQDATLVAGLHSLTELFSEHREHLPSRVVPLGDLAAQVDNLDAALTAEESPELSSEGGGHFANVLVAGLLRSCGTAPPRLTRRAVAARRRFTATPLDALGGEATTFHACGRGVVGVSVDLRRRGQRGLDGFQRLVDLRRREGVAIRKEPGLQRELEHRQITRVPEVGVLGEVPKRPGVVPDVERLTEALAHGVLQDVLRVGVRGAFPEELDRREGEQGVEEAGDGGSVNGCGFHGVLRLMWTDGESSLT